MSFRTEIPLDRRRDALVAANRAMPKVAVYHRLVDMAVRGELPMPWLVDYLRGELDRLATVSGDPYVALDVLRTRERVGELLLAVRKQDGATETARIASEVARMRSAILRAQDDWHEEGIVPR